MRRRRSPRFFPVSILGIILRAFLVDILRVAHTNPITNVSRTL
jgi:hypothetical protein